MQNQTNIPNPDIGNSTEQDPLKSFQLSDMTIAQKSDPEMGKKIAKKIWGYAITGIGGYFWNRNQRYLKNRNFANGKIDVQAMFQDRFQFNAKQNYIRLVWNTLQIVNRIVSGLVGRWMDLGEKVVVQAIDDLSQTDKQNEYQQLKFIVEHRQQLEQLQQQSGVPMMPQGDDLPRDDDELTLWREEFQRLPEEVEQELTCNEILSSNGWYDVLKEKGLHDCAEVGFIGTETYMDEQGVVHVDWVKPENAIYSWTEYDDFRDTSWRGVVPTIKISELRREYGKEFNPNNPNALTEEQLFKIAQTCKEYQQYTNLYWDGTWNYIWLRPYDEWNIRCMKFELKTVDKEAVTITNTKFNTTYVRSGLPKNSSGQTVAPSENQKVIDDTNWNIYRGVYLPDNDMLIEWGIKKNMIRPQDPKEKGNAEFSWSFVMYQNYMMRNLAIPEKIEAAVDGMILALLKIQQITARMIPPGFAIDESSAQQVDFGLGEKGNEGVDNQAVFFQTGNWWYRGIDAEGNRVPIPIQELANAGFAPQMDALWKSYFQWYQTLKDELGEDPNAISAALQPRVTSSNVDTSQQLAQYATDYIYNAYAECMKITSRKITCLIQDSIKYGAQAYRDLIKSKDVDQRIFSTDIRFLPTQQEVAGFDAMMNQSLAANQDLIMFINPFRLMQIAKENVKLAWLLFENGQKKMKIWQMQTAQQNQQATIQGQIQSAQAAEEARQQTETVKGNLEIELKKLDGENLAKTATITMVGQILSKGLDVPPQYSPFVNAVMQNIMLPLAVENEQSRQAIIQQMQAAQQQQQQMQQADKADQMQQQQQQQPMQQQQQQTQPQQQPIQQQPQAA